MPRIDRTPPYVKIAEHYRKEILDGRLAESDKLPSIVDVAKEWGVAVATASKAISQLQVEGYVRSSPRGTFVANGFNTASAPRDRLLRVRRTGAETSATEWVTALSAEVVKAPLYVAELFGEEPGFQVVRRETVTVRDKKPAALSVTWHPGRYAELVPSLMKQGRKSGRDEGALIQQIENAIGQPITSVRDDIEARESSQREANHLGLKTGSPVLCVVWRWTAGDELVEYGEQCLPGKHVIGYEYEMENSE
jgi:GntR family transcriptional regulator